MKASAASAQRRQVLDRRLDLTRGDVDVEVGLGAQPTEPGENFETGLPLQGVVHGGLGHMEAIGRIFSAPTNSPYLRKFSISIYKIKEKYFRIRPVENRDSRFDKK